MQCEMLTWAGRKVWASKSWWLQTRCKSDSQHTVKILSTIFSSILESESSFNSKFNFKMVKDIHHCFFLERTTDIQPVQWLQSHQRRRNTWVAELRGMVHAMRCGHGLPRKCEADNWCVTRGWPAPITKFVVESLVNGSTYSRSPGLRLWLQVAQTC